MQDIGIGIPKEELDNLFEKFFERGKEAQRVFTTGRGIGVYLSSQIVKAHGGKTPHYNFVKYGAGLGGIRRQRQGFNFLR